MTIEKNEAKNEVIEQVHKLLEDNSSNEIINIIGKCISTKDYQTFNIISKLIQHATFPVKDIDNLIVILADNEFLNDVEYRIMLNIQELITKYIRELNIKKLKLLIEKIFLSKSKDKIGLVLYWIYRIKDYRWNYFNENKNKFRKLLLEAYNEELEDRYKSSIIELLCNHLPNKEIDRFILKNIYSSSNPTTISESYKGLKILFFSDIKYFQEFFHTIERKFEDGSNMYPFVLNGIEEYINEQQEDNPFILFEIFQLLIEDRNFIMRPDNRKLFITLRYNIDSEQHWPIILKLINDVLKEKDNSKPHFGWYYNLYKEYEREFIKILYYIPMSDSLKSKNYLIGSPALVDLHVKIGTRIDSIFESYVKDFHNTLQIAYKNHNYPNYLLEFKKYIDLQIKLVKLKDYNISLQPFKKGDKAPEWYGIYSEFKHMLPEMEERTNLKHVLNALSGLYLLMIYHPENWYSVEYNWDSDIFDKYSIRPIVN